MGTRKKASKKRATPGLADVLFTGTQQRVLGLLFGQPERRFTQRELIVLASSGSGAVQRELARLVQSGLVSVTVVGAQKQYQANADAPIFAELCGIVEKTVGVAGQVRAALEPLAARVSFAAIYGSVVTGGDTASSDIDVLVVSDALTLEEVFAALAVAEKRIGRRVSPTVYSRDEFTRRRRERQPFLTKVLGRKHVVLFGDADAASAAR